METKSSLALMALLLAAMVVLSPVALAAPPTHARSLTAQATITPRTYTLVLSLSTNKTSESIKALSAHVDYMYNNKTCTTSLNAGLHLEPARAGNSSLQAYSTGSIYVNSTAGIVRVSTQSESHVKLEALANKTNVKLSLDRTGYTRALLNTSSQSGYTDRRSHVTLDLSLVNATQTLLTLGADLNLSSHTILTNKSSLTRAAARGPVSIQATVGGRPLKISFNLDSKASLNETVISENVTYVELEATANLSFKDYLTAMAVYQYLSMIVAFLNLTKYVKITPPTSPTAPVITVEVEYEGNLTPAEVEHIIPSGIPAKPVTPPTSNLTKLEEEVSSILPVALPEGVNGTLNATYTLKAGYSHGSLDVALAANARATGGFCKANYTLDKVEASLEFNNETASLQLHLTLHGRTAEPYTSTITTTKLLKGLIDKAKDEVDSVLVTLKASDGVAFNLAGSEYKRLVFTAENYTSLEDVGVSYGGAKIFMHKGGVIVSSGPQANLTLPPMAEKVTFKGARRMLLKLPVHGRLHKHMIFRISNDIASNVSLVIHKGARIASKVKLATLPPSQVQIPSSIKAHKAGPALVVEGVEGPVTVVLPFKKEYPGKPAILVVHSNGTVEVVTKVVARDGYIIANVTASTTYTPVILAGGGGGGGTTTSTTSTGKTTSTTTTKTTTSTTSRTTTTHTTHTTTKTKTTTSTTSKTTKTTTKTTPTTSKTSRTTGTSTSPTKTGTTSPTTSPTTTTKAKSRAALIAAVVIVVIVIAAAAALLARR